MFLYQLNKDAWKIFSLFMEDLKRKAALAQTFIVAGSIAALLFILFLILR